MRATVSRVFILKTLTNIINFTGIILFSHFYSQRTLGTYFFFLSVVGIAGLFADGGLSGAVAKRVSERQGTKNIVTSALFIKTALLCIITLPLYIITTFEILPMELPPSVLLVGLWFFGARGLITSILDGENKVGKSSLLLFLEQVLWVFFGLTFTAFPVGGLIIAHLGATLIISLVGILSVSTSIGLPTSDSFKSLYSYAKYNFISQSGWKVYNWLDTAIIGVLLGSEFVAAYEIAWRVSEGVMTLSRSIGAVLFPRLSYLSSSGNDAKIQEIVSSAVLPGLLITIPATFGSVLVGEKILSLVFGSAYASASIVLGILILEKNFQSVYVVLRRSIESINRPDLVALTTIGTILMNALLNVLLVPIVGIIGAALGTLFSFSAASITYAIIFDREIGISFPISEIIWSIFGSSMMYILGTILNNYWTIQNIQSLLFFISVFSVIYFIILFSRPSVRYSVFDWE